MGSRAALLLAALIAAACGGSPAPEACTCPDDGNACTNDMCVDGACVHPPVFDGNSCLIGTDSGECHAGACCTTCWDGTACQPGTTLAACGSGNHGSMCSVCTGDTCDVPTCMGGCVVEPTNGPTCPHCGSLNEKCCAGMSCDAMLTCTFVILGEDLGEYRCTTP